MKLIILIISFSLVKKIKQIWSLTESRFLAKFSKRISLSCQDALLGIVSKDGLSNQMFLYINHLILVAKLCISKFKYGNASNISCLFERECRFRNLMQ